MNKFCLLQAKKKNSDWLLRLPSDEPPLGEDTRAISQYQVRKFVLVNLLSLDLASSQKYVLPEDMRTGWHHYSEMHYWSTQVSINASSQISERTWWDSWWVLWIRTVISLTISLIMISRLGGICNSITISTVKAKVVSLIMSWSKKENHKGYIPVSRNHPAGALPSFTGVWSRWFKWTRTWLVHICQHY